MRIRNNVVEWFDNSYIQLTRIYDLSQKKI